MLQAIIKARRVSGAAIVVVERCGRTRRYRVGLKRFHRLKWVGSAWIGCGGYFGNSHAELKVFKPGGYWDAVRWILRHGCRRSRACLRG